MAVDVLRNGMHDNVGAMLQRILHIGTHEGVVDNHQNAVPVGNFSNLRDINHSEGRV